MVFKFGRNGATKKIVEQVTGNITTPLIKELREWRHYWVEHYTDYRPDPLLSPMLTTYGVQVALFDELHHLESENEQLLSRVHQLESENKRLRWGAFSSMGIDDDL